MRHSIIVKITGLLFLMLVVALANIATIYFFLAQQEHDARIVNVAGRQRMLTQRISKLSLSVATGEIKDQGPLNDAIQLYETSLHTLWHGCVDPENGTMGALIPSAPKAMTDLFLKNQVLWDAFKKNAEIVANGDPGTPAFSEAIQQIKLDNDPLLEISDQITLAFDKQGGEKVIFLLGLLIALLVVDILFFVLGFLMAKKIVQPLRVLSGVVQKVGKGDFEAKAKINSHDEIGELATTFNKMTEDLRTAIDKERASAAQAAVAESKKNQAEELNRQKSEFVATVSHEFLNPLAAIQESMGLLLDGVIGEVTEEQKKILQLGKRTSTRMTRLVRNLLDLSKIESGKMAVKREKVDVALLIEEVVTAHKNEAAEKRLILDQHIPPGAGWIWADHDMLTQVVINLLSNALKYTPEGGEVNVTLTALRNEVRFEFSNTGPGIPQENFSKIFDKFERLTAEQREGTGLGLPIAKDIVELHKGRIWIESELGKGSKFIVVLPRDLRNEKNARV